MELVLKVYNALPCATAKFTVNGIKCDIDMFVNNYDNGDGEEIEYGCNNRVTDKLDLDEVRRKLPKKLKLTDKEIEKVQKRLAEELVCGGCGWCV